MAEVEASLVLPPAFGISRPHLVSLISQFYRFRNPLGSIHREILKNFFLPLPPQRFQVF